MTASIKPCPFCGSVPVLPGCLTTQVDPSGKWGAVACGCGAIGPDVRKRYGGVESWADDAIREWNKRATDEEPPRNLTGGVAA